MLLDKKDIRSFNAKLATEIGCNEAIFLQQIHYFLQINEETDRNKKKGRYWTYNSYKEWQKKVFPFWSTRTIGRVVRSLEEQGLLITDNFNKDGFDKTKWYTINYDKVKEIEKQVYSSRQSGTTSNTKCRDGGRQNGSTNTKDLPKTSTKTSNNNMSSSDKNSKNQTNPPYEKIINHLNRKADRNFSHTTRNTQKLINGRFNDGYKFKDFKEVIDKKTADWKGEKMEKYLRPDTLFRPSNFENYLNEPWPEDSDKAEEEERQKIIDKQLERAEKYG